MMKYPLEFAVQSATDANWSAPWSIRAGEFETSCDIPKEFSGEGKAFSPEDLFALALTNCFLGTLKVYAKNSKVSYEKIEAKSVITLDQIEKAVAVTKWKIFVRIEGCAQRERMEALCKKTLQSGFLLNSVTAQKEMELEIL